MKSATWIGLMIGWVGLTGLAHGQVEGTPDILHSGPGQITWANVDTSMYYTVEWRNALTTGEWQSVYSIFRDIQSQAGTITRQIPTFFRVRAYPVPEFIRYLTATSHWMTAGYYAEDIDLTAVDPNLAAGNIRGGVSIFGVGGKPEVVDTEDATAFAADLMEGKVAFVAGNALTGTIATVSLSDTTAVVRAGYMAATNLALVDTDLVAGNICSGVTMFGVPGSVLQAAGDATAAEVLTGRTFSRVDAVDVSGSMPNRGAQTFIPGTAAQAVLQGYHDGEGEVAGDADLVSGNIKTGVSIFGVTGSVVESAGDAGVDQVLAGTIFSKTGEAGLTGTMPDHGGLGFMPGVADVSISAGYYDGSGVVAGDAALITGNIRAGQTIFGVEGKSEVVDTTSGDVVPGELLSGKKAWVAGAEVTGTMANREAPTWTPGTAEQTLDAGYYSGGTVQGDTNLLAANIREGVTIFGVTGTGEDMALIPAGDFVKTDHPDGSNWATNYISAFYMSRTHITRAQWGAVRSWARTNGYADLPFGSGEDADHPVQTLNWYDVVKWCNARSEMEGRTPAYYTDGTHATVYRTGSLDLTNTCVAWLTGGYRLPTESEWEKAARGGLHAHRFPWGHTNRISHDQANFCNNGGEAYQYGTTGYHPDYNTGAMPYTSPVSSFAPNGSGLYDMAGNVSDWCWDRSAVGEYYVAGSDPRGPDTGTDRVYRGGSWYNIAQHCRSAYRSSSNPSGAYSTRGFRVVLPAADAP